MYNFRNQISLVDWVSWKVLAFHQWSNYHPQANCSPSCTTTRLTCPETAAETGDSICQRESVTVEDYIFSSLNSLSWRWELKLVAGQLIDPFNIGDFHLPQTGSPFIISWPSLTLTSTTTPDIGAPTEPGSDVAFSRETASTAEVQHHQNQPGPPREARKQPARPRFQGATETGK